MSLARARPLIASSAAAVAGATSYDVALRWARRLADFERARVGANALDAPYAKQLFVVGRLALEAGVMALASQYLVWLGLFRS